jgi:hypothetical protein
MIKLCTGVSPTFSVAWVSASPYKILPASPFEPAVKYSHQCHSHFSKKGDPAAFQADFDVDLESGK